MNRKLAAYYLGFYAGMVQLQLFFQQQLGSDRRLNLGGNDLKAAPTGRLTCLGALERNLRDLAEVAKAGPALNVGLCVQELKAAAERLTPAFLHGALVRVDPSAQVGFSVSGVTQGQRLAGLVAQVLKHAPLLQCWHSVGAELAGVIRAATEGNLPHTIQAPPARRGRDLRYRFSRLGNAIGGLPDAILPHFPELVALRAALADGKHRTPRQLLQAALGIRGGRKGSSVSEIDTLIELLSQLDQCIRAGLDKAPSVDRRREKTGNVGQLGMFAED